MINLLMFQQISSELSHFTWDKKKVKINLDLDRSILDKAKKKKKMHFMTYREISHQFLNKESVE